MVLVLLAYICKQRMLKEACVKVQLYQSSLLTYTVKPVLSGHSKRPKIGFQDHLSLNAGQKYCRMLQKSILQYFRPSLSYHVSLRSLFCLFLRGGLRQVLLYTVGTLMKAQAKSLHRCLYECKQQRLALSESAGLFET